MFALPETSFQYLLPQLFYKGVSKNVCYFSDHCFITVTHDPVFLLFVVADSILIFKPFGVSRIDKISHTHHKAAAAHRKVDLLINGEYFKIINFKALLLSYVDINTSEIVSAGFQSLK